MKRIWVDREKCLGCKSCELQCAIERDSVSRTLLGSVRETPLPAARVGVFGTTGRSFPLQCRHCQDAACIRACPAGAMRRDEATEAVFVEREKCRGCWMCVMACPFGAIIPHSAYKVAVKCDACMHMEELACVSACPTGALSQGDAGDFQKVLLAKRGRLVLFALENPGAGKVALEFTGKDDKP
ncbi:4Fe-4S dicluster domain-containing protein [Acetonema longum]|uniref:4Fe-4S ferredoxin iron-sulfur binding domain protein n=1 Tax=Acetonema longum DSM 6540 TaxID=1009370 RepID=F7NE19_9FIRM|nr:4Fe-4S dicluster domain-containing protein [Acetonema longum]EGO65674.1 4Fe-4S ferredoxin iron-sulfur binding domain protein [Acetonema longum DSM 6540]